MSILEKTNYWKMQEFIYYIKKIVATELAMKKGLQSLYRTVLVYIWTFQLRSFVCIISTLYQK
jgi:hypothetical protein